MSALGILRRYAQTEPGNLPASVLLTHTSHTLTIFDAFPKSIFHFLVLPRITLTELANLQSLLKCEKTRAKEILLQLREDANAVKMMIQDEMMSRYGFKWGIWVGFHAVPSMEHVHLHVLSNDLCSPAMKNKKHLNSFHPKLGFFLHLDDVLDWFDADASYYQTMSKLKKTAYEPLLKEALSCWRCGKGMKNMPAMKAHLQEEWEKERDRERAKAAKKTRPSSDPPTLDMAAE